MKRLGTAERLGTVLGIPEPSPIVPAQAFHLEFQEISQPPISPDIAYPSIWRDAPRLDHQENKRAQSGMQAFLLELLYFLDV